MKIGELARSANLHASAIRYYEKIGLLAPAARVNGQRRYPAEALDRLLLIRFASEMDFTLPEIAVFLKGLRNNAPVGPRWRKLAYGKIAEVERERIDVGICVSAEVERHLERCLQLKKLLANLLHCGCASLPVCVRCLSLSPNLRAIRGKDRARRPQRPPTT